MIKLEFDSFKHTGLKIPTNQEVEIGNCFGINDEPIQFTSGSEIFNVTLKPPFNFLGAGRQKFVVSANTNGIENLTKSQNESRVACGLLNENNSSCLSGLQAYTLAKKTGFSTYPWYLESLDSKRCLMPDLTQEGVIVSSNTRSLSSENCNQLNEDWPNIIVQIRAMIETAIQFYPPIKITYDTFFLILKQNALTHVMLGDFDGVAVSERHLREDLTKNLESIKKIQLYTKEQLIMQINKLIDDFSERFSLNLKYVYENAQNDNL